MRRHVSILLSVLFIVASASVHAALTVLATIPVGDTTANTVSVTFSEPMVVLAKLNAPITDGPMRFTPAASGVFRWTGTSTISFTPDKPFTKNTRYTAVLSALTAVSGQRMQREHTWSFDTPRPRLLNSFPYNDPNGNNPLRPDAKIFLYFNMPVVASANSIALLENGIAKRFTVRYSVQGDFASTARKLKDTELQGILVVEPMERFAKGARIAVSVKKGHPALEGDLGLREDAGVSFITYADFAYTGKTMQNILPRNYGDCDVLRLTFSNPVKYRELIKHLEFSPSIVIAAEEYEEWKSREFCLSLTCVPEKTYALTIKSGLVDDIGQSLKGDVAVRFTVGSYLPYFSLPDGSGIIEAYEGRRIPVTVINPAGITVESKVIARDDIIPYSFWRDGYDSDDKPTSKMVAEFAKKFSYQLSLPFRPEVTRNEYHVVPLDLAPHLMEKAFGLVPRQRQYGYLALKVSGEHERGNMNYTPFLQMTDLGITTKFSGVSNFVFVTSLKNGAPAPKIDIELRDDRNRKLWSGKTGNDGTAHLPGFATLSMGDNTPRQWIFASDDKKKDEAYINSTWETGVSPWEFDIPYSYEGYPTHAGDVHTERGIYRPGETVHCKGAARVLSGSDWSTPKNMHFSYKITDSRYNEITNGTLTASDHGTFAFDVAVPKDAPTGSYSMTVMKKRAPKNAAQNIIDKLKQKETEEEETFSIYGGFRVEMFQPLSFETRVAVDDRNYFFGDETLFHINGWYLFGAPMADKKAHYTVTANETYYSPPNNAGFRFAKMHWFENDDYGARSERIGEADAMLNAKGEAQVPVKLVLDGSVHAMNVSFEATVYGENEERVSGRKAILVHGSEYYIGVKRRDYFVETKKPSSIEVITANPDGTRRDNDAVDVAVYRRYWQSKRVAGVNGRAQWESEKVDDLITRASVTVRKGGSIFSFTPELAGLYIMRFTSKDARGRTVCADEYFYAFGGGYVPWEMKNDDRIDLVIEKENYAPGETARVLIKSPYDECTALITVEREHVLTSWVTNLRGTACVIDVPVRTSYLPNVYIGAALVKGRVENRTLTNDADLGKPSFKIGYASINVAPEERRLAVAVKTDHATRSPGEALMVSFTVKDRQNRPVAAECEVAVCDAGVLNLIGYKTPDFFDAFYGPRPLGVLSVDSRLAIIGQRNFGKKGENPGGGGEMDEGVGRRRELGMDMFSFRKNFLSTAFYKASISADKNGNGSVRFSVPDNLTTFRVMVIAADTASRFGSGESAVIVKKYLMLKPTMPRFAITGDSFEAGATVYNYTEKDAEIAVQMELTGAEIQGIKIRTVKVPVNGSADVRFPIACETPGTVKVRIAAKAGANSDAVETTFPVKVPRMTETVATVGSVLDAPVRESVKIPAANEVFAGAGAFTATLSPSAFSGLKGGIDYLIGYPYGCLEQKISKVMPIVLSKELITSMKLTAYSADELDAIVNEVIKVMNDYKRADGGFSYWPGSAWTSPWLTAYAIHFMLAAKAADIDIDGSLFESAVEYLANYARSKEYRRDLPFSSYCLDSIDAYIAYVLARGGKPDRALLTSLIAKKPDLTLYARANLLMALHHAKYQSEYIEEVKQSLFNGIEVTGTTARCDDSMREGMYWIHSSAVRDTSVVLTALMETGTQNPLCEKLVNYLVMTRQKKGCFDSTQDNVSAFAAMNAYLSVYEKDAPRLTAEIAAAGKTLFTGSFASRTDSAVTKSFDFSGFDRTAPFDLTVSRTGKGRLYYGLKLAYAPRELLASRDEGIAVAKRYETVDGRVVDGKQFTRGTDYVAVVTVRAPRERHFVVLDDPIPAGFIVLNRNFATESQTAYKDVKTTGRWWGSFNHFENYDDRVLAFADSLTPGEHVYRYVLRAVTPGTYALPATKAEEMYTPDVFGYHGQSFVEVK
ncbi:MAG: alpha-2-macroglobulin family protein [Spirochaetota bacterium]